jgi:hypothetical protein
MVDPFGVRSVKHIAQQAFALSVKNTWQRLCLNCDLNSREKRASMDKLSRRREINLINLAKSILFQALSGLSARAKALKSNSIGCRYRELSSLISSNF